MSLILAGKVGNFLPSPLSSTFHEASFPNSPKCLLQAFFDLPAFSPNQAIYSSNFPILGKDERPIVHRTGDIKFNSFCVVYTCLHSQIVSTSS
jgi:hypothetical protein